MEQYSFQVFNSKEEYEAECNWEGDPADLGIEAWWYDIQLPSNLLLNSRFKPGWEGRMWDLIFYCKCNIEEEDDPGMLDSIAVISLIRSALCFCWDDNSWIVWYEKSS